AEKPAEPAAKPAGGGKYAGWPTTNPDGSGPSKTQPTKLLLGREGDGIFKVLEGSLDKPGSGFNHAKHNQPDHEAKCESCHHTNTDAKAEGVLKCVACHRKE